MVALNQRVLGPEHPESIDTLSAFGTFLMETNRLAEAHRKCSRTVLEARSARARPHAQLYRQRPGKSRSARLPTGRFLRCRGATLEERARQSIASACRPHGFIATSLTTLGRTQLALHRPKEAQQSLVEAVKIWQVEYGQDSAGYNIASAGARPGQGITG